MGHELPLSRLEGLILPVGSSGLRVVDADAVHYPLVESWILWAGADASMSYAAGTVSGPSQCLPAAGPVVA